MKRVCTRILLLLAVLLRLPAVVHAHFYLSCFRQLKDADADGNYKLVPEEYIAFIEKYTVGNIKAPLSNSLIKPFTSVAKEMVLPISGIHWDAAKPAVVLVKSFCNSVDMALLKSYSIAIPFDQCVGALQAADTEAPNGKLNKVEFAAFLAVITGDDSYNSLSNTLSQKTEDVFNDMAVNNMIDGSQGSDYLKEFCHRADLAVTLDRGSSSTDTVNEAEPPPVSDMPSTESDKGSKGKKNSAQPDESTKGPNDAQTAAPTQESTEDSTDASAKGPKESETSAPSSESMEEASTESDESSVDGQASATAPSAPLPKYAMTSDEFKFCERAMLLTDRDRNNLLSLEEYKLLVKRLSNSTNYAHVQLKTVYETLQHGDSAEISIQGSKPGQITTKKERANLKRTCSHTYSFAANTAPSLDIQAANLVQQGSKGGDLLSKADEEFEYFFSRCKVALFIADKNRDTVLQQNEFAEIISRLALQSKKTDFISLDRRFQDCYHKDLDDVVHVIGSRPGHKATEEETANLRSVCTAIDRTIASFKQGSS